jgi:integrase/recombinase XerC
MSNSCSQDSENSEHNVFSGISVRQDQGKLFSEFLSQQDISEHTVLAVTLDIRKFAKWFSTANREPWDVERVTVRDVTDFRDYLKREKKQAASTINRNLSTVKKYFKWLFGKGHIPVNPTASVKELKRQPLAPQGLTRAEVRKLLREVELRKDVRNKAVFSLILYTGARLSDVVNLELSDLAIGDRSGTVFYRYGKGSKQRTVPLPLQARKALVEYLKGRPPVDSQKVFVGERGPLNSRGIQAVFEKYRALTGIENLHCHVLRHTFSHNFLSSAEKGGASGNLVQLAQIVGHESLNTTAIYTRNSVEQLGQAVERVVY